MKILGISGGTKNGRNDSMVIEALMGAKEAGAEIEFIHLRDLNLKYCTGCNACAAAMEMGKGSVCTIRDDDFEWLLDKMLDADGILFSMPIFNNCAPAIYHTLMDRMGPRFDKGMFINCIKIAEENGKTIEDQRMLNPKVVSFMSVGGSDWSTSVENEFILHAACDMWTIVQNEVFQWAATLVMDEERMAKVHQIGVNLANAAKDMENAKYLSEPGICDICNSHHIRFSADGTAICAGCGTVGKVEVVDGAYKFVYTPEEGALAHNTLTGKAKHSEDIGNSFMKQAHILFSDEYKEKLESYAAFIQPTVPNK